MITKCPASNSVKKFQKPGFHLAFMTSFMTFVKNVNTLEIIGIHLKYQFLLKSAF